MTRPDKPSDRPSDRAIAAAFLEAESRPGMDNVSAVTGWHWINDRARELDTEPRACDGDALLKAEEFLVSCERFDLANAVHDARVAAQRNEGDGE